MNNLPEPVFFNTNADTLVGELVADYEAETSFKLAPAQAERLVIQAIAFRWQIKLIQMDEAARQNFLRFARYPMLDYLGELTGVERLPATKAVTTIQFNIVPGHPGIVIPAGVRIRTIDGLAIFETLEQKTVAIGDLTAAVRAECTVEGEAGNNYPVNQVSIILDPQAYVASAANITITSSGSNEENDEGLRERIRLAPSSFSTAGPDDAYIFHTKSASALIISVGINSSVPGTVNVYPLVKGGGITPTEIITEVQTKLNGKKIRPLTDTVVVASPGVVNYTIDVDLTLLSGADETAAIKTVTDNLNAYADERKVTLGMDAVINQITAISMIKGVVYDLSVISPVADVVVGFNNTAVCTAINVNVIGYSDE